MQDPWGQGLHSCMRWPVTVEHSSLSYQKYTECSGFKPALKTFLFYLTFSQQTNSFHSDWGVLFSFCLGALFVMDVMRYSVWQPLSAIRICI